MDPISNRKKVMRVHAAQDKKKVGIFVLYAVVTLVLLSGVAYVITYLQDRPFTNPPASSQPPFSENKTGLLKDIDRLKKVVEANPENMDSTLRLANLLHDVSLADQAIPYYERYLDKNPQDADARVDMGICYFELSRKDTSKSKPELNTAVGEMEKALAYNPRHQLACYNLGIVNLSAGNFQKSSEWFKRCIEIDPAAEISNKAKQLLTDHNSVK
jgi:tetratricopeptide (TPR) repeat protein